MYADDPIPLNDLNECACCIYIYPPPTQHTRLNAGLTYIAHEGNSETPPLPPSLPSFFRGFLANGLDGQTQFLCKPRKLDPENSFKFFFTWNFVTLKYEKFSQRTVNKYTINISEFKYV
jgi:hypothetical protein